MGERMARLRRRANTVLSPLFPEKRLFVQSQDATTYLRLTPLSQLLLGAATLAAAGWMAIATAALVLGLVSTDSSVSQAVVLQDAYRARLDELAAERDQRASEAWSAQNRFQIAMEQISRQQTVILQSVEEQRELTAALDLMRARLQEAVAQRDTIAATNDTLVAQMSEVSETLARNDNSGADLTSTLQAVSGALAEAVIARDAASTERSDLAQQVAELELRISLNARRQDEMVEQLEQAVALSFGPLEKVFAEADIDLDGLIATVRDTHSGQGGPLGAATVSTRSFDDANLTSRFDTLMLDLDRVNLMRIAAGKIPYVMPVKAGYRFTSGFGMRRDPKGAGRRLHRGVDFAAPKNTPIYATADGVVTSARMESGFGNAVRIRHDFGFETLYAHQSRLRVKPGQQVSRGEHIGDMGSTGRSTGVHLHYEVHLNGEPVNPMIYLEAAKNVF